MCSAAGGTISNRPAPPDTETPIFYLITSILTSYFCAMRCRRAPSLMAGAARPAFAVPSRSVPWR